MRSRIATILLGIFGDRLLADVDESKAGSVSFGLRDLASLTIHDAKAIHALGTFVDGVVEAKGGSLSIRLFATKDCAEYKRAVSAEHDAKTRFDKTMRFEPKGRSAAYSAVGTHLYASMFSQSVLCTSDGVEAVAPYVLISSLISCFEVVACYLDGLDYTPKGTVCATLTSEAVRVVPVPVVAS